ncbi:MAG TPA: aminotransferase class I/II-fold pyridoxal phosphate-dependent enzyme [Xanthomonadales bacterium]|nr:aminotransferase class I/II-fold pyridoxal phosphate-dependent enzyme [Xanthomonadales bacterium]
MKKATQAVHAGKRHSVNQGGVVTPIFMSTAISYMDDSEVRYPRYFNTINSQVTADKLACLEESEAAIVTSSGMGAISSVMLALLKPGDHVVVLEGLYGGSHALVLEEFQRLGIEWSFVAADPDSMRSAFQPNSRMVYVESPTNPLLRVLNLKEVASLAKSNRAISVIDGTFATPILQNPIALGFDIVLHSGTKYLGGHSDLCCGVVAGNEININKVRNTAITYGTSLNAQDCALLERSLQTLELRVMRQSENALVIAQAMEKHPLVRKVNYPGLAAHPQHEIARRQMRAFGGMLSFELDESIEVESYLRNLNLIGCAVSLGGVESTICQPVATSHMKMPEQERQRLGITPRLLRLSVGIEDPQDLLEDLLPG